MKTAFRTSLLAMALFAGVTLAQADAIDDITAAGQINVGVFADFPPFSSASADMSLKGYDMDVAQYIADTLKVKLNPVSVTGQNRIPYLTEKRVDMLMSVGYSKERAEVIDFAAAYAPYYIAVIGPAALEVKDKADLADKSIAVNRGTLEDTSLTEAAPASADIRTSTPSTTASGSARRQRCATIVFIASRPKRIALAAAQAASSAVSSQRATPLSGRADTINAT